jgi:glycosyltransferase involved in cell wall biosynthesis
VIHDYFTPAWKAGGPIRSLAQLIETTSADFSFNILCSAYDFGSKNKLTGIQTNTWTKQANGVNIYYNEGRITSLNFLIKRYVESNPDIIYINGLFSFQYNIICLLTARKYRNHNPKVKIILSPRGMLHPGALSQKRFKKKIYLEFLKISGLPKLIHWHATDVHEAEFIKKQFGDVPLSIAGNFPKLSGILSSPPKQPGSMIMGTLALISPMKNHLEILTSLKHITSNVIWHIYGPVKDQQYWNECLHLINSLPNNIKVVYHGALEPARVHELFEKIHLYIQPSKSENFGHAILEALSAGKPVITTNTTPFTNLNEYKAGYTVPINQLEIQLTRAIDMFSKMGPDEFSTYQKGSADFANNFVNVANLKKQYAEMFQIQ